LESTQKLSEIELITVNGQRLNRWVNPVFLGTTFSIESIPSGFYFIKIKSENSEITKKICIQ
jgi:hypothetical protein